LGQVRPKRDPPCGARVLRYDQAMALFPWTSLLALLLGTLYLGLIAQVILLRRGRRVAFGDGGDRDLRGAPRAQVNAGEQIPLFLLIFGLSEAAGAARFWLVLVGLVFLLGRLVHAYGMRFAVHRFRVLGTGLNLTALALVLLLLLVSRF